MGKGEDATGGQPSSQRTLGDRSYGSNHLFSKARVDHMWDVMETTFSGVTVIRDTATQEGDMTDDNDLQRYLGG